MLIRHAANPLISPAAVLPSHPDFQVIGAFNAGATIYQNQTLLLLRVAERPINLDTQTIACPQYDDKGEIRIRYIHRDDPSYDTSDPRKVEHRQTGELLLTSVSHLRLARSSDGINFSIDSQPFLAPATAEESFGVEDARITQIDDTYYINYTAVSRFGIATSLASTCDFVSIERHGIIFTPANRDVVIFPQRINSLYHCYHRPMPGMFGGYHIWTASSPDLINWGKHQRILETSTNGWETGRVGGGAPPILTEHGWLSIYHAADPQDRYCLGAFMTALNDPTRLIARSREAILIPEAEYETKGFFSNVVFTCGAVVVNGILRVYYGSADEHMAVAEVSLEDFVRRLLNQEVSV